MRPGIVALLIGLCGAAHAGAPTVAVMPFRDLSQPQSSVGEAIRETVTADLRALSGMRVVERGSLDKVLAEQHLQEQRSDLDAGTAARVGKLLGATLIVAGAYQEVPPSVRLTARFVRVETGEVVGTAKVDGRAVDLLRLQDKVTAELLKSAGLGSHVKKIVERSRPDIKPKVMELYGQAVLAQNDDKRHELLLLAVNEDKTFSYAADDLAALEKRLKSYQANADAVKAKTLDEQIQKLKTETDPQKVYTLTTQILQGLMTARRFHALEAMSREVLKAPVVSYQPGTGDTHDFAGFYLVLSEAQLHEDDAVLRDGEAYLRSNPQSMWFGSVKNSMEQVIRKRREAEEKKAELPKALADVPSQGKWDLCRMGHVYRSHRQNAEAQRLFRACAEVGNSSSSKAEATYALIYADLDLADWASARRDIASYEKLAPAEYQKNHAGWEMMLPGD